MAARPDRHRQALSTPKSASNTARQIAEVVLTRFTPQADSRAVNVPEGYRLDNLLLELNEPVEDHIRNRPLARSASAAQPT